MVRVGRDPTDAHYLKRPNDCTQTFGWGDEPPVVTDEDRANYESAEALTDRMVRHAYSAVDESGADALVAGLTAIAPALALGELRRKPRGQRPFTDQCHASAGRL